MEHNREVGMNQMTDGEFLDRMDVLNARIDELEATIERLIRLNRLKDLTEHEEDE